MTVRWVYSFEERIVPKRTRMIAGMESMFLGLLIASVIHLPGVVAQIPELEWQAAYGGSDGELCLGGCQAEDGGYVAVGFTESFSSDFQSMYLVKTDAMGDTLWTRVIRDIRGSRACSVQGTEDGGFIVAGRCVNNSDSGYLQNDILMMKFDGAGNLTWTRNYGSIDQDEGASSIELTFDGGYICVGSRSYRNSYRKDIYLVRTDSSDDTLWTRTFGTENSDHGKSIQQTSDGGFIITGSTNSIDSNRSDLLLMKIDSNGSITWTRNYGGNSYESGQCVQQTMDGGYIVAGTTGSFGAGMSDVFVVRTSFNGDTLWTRVFGGIDDDWGNAILETSFGNFLVASTSQSFGPGNASIYLIRINDLGDTLWTTTLGGSGQDWCSDICQTRDGGFLLVGNTSSIGQGGRDFYLIKLGPENGIVGEPELGSILHRIVGTFSDRIGSCMLISYYSFKQFGEEQDFFELLRKLAACYGISLDYESTVELCRTATSYYTLDLFDTVHSLRVQVCESTEIPESTVNMIPLAEYDTFDVSELFRAMTIEELEASLTYGYPYQWLEEILKDETIPWEDRYWLDRRIRAAISQNLHVFYDVENDPIYVYADAIYPGEYYWREYMIADPVGWNVPEDAVRPVELEELDIGHLYDQFGYRVGEIAVSTPEISISRKADIGVIVSGGNYYEYPDRQPYACFLYPDGSFNEIALDPIESHDCVVSPDGSIAAFFSSEVSTFDEYGSIINTFYSPLLLRRARWAPAITGDGQYVCHLGGYTVEDCLIDCFDETVEVLSERADSFNSIVAYNFSPDGAYLCLGGGSEQLMAGQLLELETGNKAFYPIDSTGRRLTITTSSNNGFCVAMTSLYEGQSGRHIRLDIRIKDNRFNFSFEPFPLNDITTTDVSPNGYFLIMNPFHAARGNPSAYGYPQDCNLPLVVMQIEGR